MQKVEQAKWVFSRRSVKQLGYIKETQRIDIDKQIKLLFELWDSYGTGIITPDEIVHRLISIGLGGSPEFTKTVTIF